MDEITVTRLINGPEAFTPDNEFCLGESEVRGFFVAAGFCAHGLAGAGGIGKVMAEWIVEGEPSLDLWHMDIRRFGPHYRSPAYTLKRTREVYETYYDIRYPGHERQAGRPLRVSSAYEWHRAHGAAFGEKSGWERVNWYESNAAGRRRVAAPATAGRGCSGRRRSGPSIAPRARPPACSTSPRSPSSRSRARARPSCSSGSATTASRARSAQITYTQMLNRRGGIECDFTVARLAEERFGIVTGTAFGNHDASWIRSHLPDDGSVARHRRHRALGLLRPVGPARPRRPRPADARPARLRLHAPARDHRRRRAGARAARDLRRRARLGALLPDRVRRGPLARRCSRRARRTACVACGYRAIDSLRLEKGYRVWARRHHARRDAARGRARASASARDKQFIGADALRRAAARRLRAITLADPRAVALGNEPVRVGGEIVGRVTSGGYGYTVERSIAYAYLPAEVERGQRGRDRHLRRVGRRARSRPSRCSIRRGAGAGLAAPSPLRRVPRRRPWVHH